ncbi:hypothetical protein Q5H91_10550 [Sphingomonas sp. KR1UV-12]|uniref:Uncharacterized protein n=1 Tax=Sphingomonas aurea TaxID=3063994 RepID=A0ABT9EL12_9SPHN|nr:hypothetical protein [Sphingomonas sp. KR1UV-12]MDP1027654.1 hypothetical protein [Sphingomonas sp. KR1UV-12]
MVLGPLRDPDEPDRALRAHVPVMVGLTSRGDNRIVYVAQTIADPAGSDVAPLIHVAGVLIEIGTNRPVTP